MPLNTGQDAMTEAYRLLQDVAPVDWATYFESVGKHDAHEIVKELQRIAEQCVRAAVYLETRSFDGDHWRAVKTQNKVANAVRKSIGFTYPSEITF